MFDFSKVRTRGWSAERKLEFYSMPEPNSGCFLWLGTLVNGYGRMMVGGTHYLAHRMAYELKHGPIPDDLVIDHLCRVRCCVNPDHLEPVSNFENIARGFGIGVKNAEKMSCKHGHPYTPENTYWRPNGKGRDCKQCIDARYFARQERKKRRAV